MSKNFEINPCKACTEKFKNGDCGINDINNCCYDTLTAFSGSSSVDSVRRTKQAKNCVQCVLNNMKTLGPFGRTFCDFKLAPPPIWSQVPHYVPELLNQGYTKEEAMQKCLQYCDKTTYPNDCKDNCYTDAAAVEEYQYVPKIELPSYSAAPPENKDKKPILLFVIAGIIILLSLILITKKTYIYFKK